MKFRRPVLAALFAIALIGVASAFIARAHPTTPSSQSVTVSSIEPSVDGGFSPAPRPTACPGGCPTLTVCTQVHQKCQCPRGNGRCAQCPDGSFICVLQHP